LVIIFAKLRIEAVHTLCKAFRNVQPFTRFAYQRFSSCFVLYNTLATEKPPKMAAFVFDFVGVSHFLSAEKP